MPCLLFYSISIIYRYRKTGKAQYPARREGDPPLERHVVRHGSPSLAGWSRQRSFHFGVSSAPGDATVSPYPKNQAIFFINGPDTVSCPSVGPPASGFGERYPPG